MSLPVPTIVVPPENPPTELVLIIFIHGFKGDDTTFRDFPQRIQQNIGQTVEYATVESIVFPAYETKGDLTAAVVRFADWLTDLTVKREVEHGMRGGIGKAKIILCGHSMGGLLAADALIEFVQTRPDPVAPLWPNIVACLAYDTPYLGLQPALFKNGATQVASYAQSARSLFGTLPMFGSRPTSPTSSPPDTPPPMSISQIAGPSSPGSDSSAASATSPTWRKWAPAAYAIGGALIAGAAAGTAYYRREDISGGYAWMSDHMKYIGNLWNEKELAMRLEKLIDIEERLGVLFTTFYTYITPNIPSRATPPRTFIILPKPESRSAMRFVLNRNTLTPDEIQAHTGMFDSKTNDGYYELGLTTAKLIREAIQAHRQAEAARKARSRPPSRSPSRPPSRPISRPPSRPPSPLRITVPPNTQPNPASPVILEQDPPRAALAGAPQTGSHISNGEDEHVPEVVGTPHKLAGG